MPSVISRAITFADYDEGNRQLTLTFASGKSYTYYGVPSKVYFDLMASDSKGSFYNKYIRDKYPDQYAATKN